jgi:hypothetical protein
MILDLYKNLNTLKRLPPNNKVNKKLKYLNKVYIKFNFLFNGVKIWHLLYEKFKVILNFSQFFGFLVLHSKTKFFILKKFKKKY